MSTDSSYFVFFQIFDEYAGGDEVLERVRWDVGLVCREYLG